MKNIATRLASTALVLAAAAAPAAAQVTVSGSTLGCFGMGCTNFAAAQSYGISGTGETIQFTGSSFSGTTNPVTNGVSIGNFGSFVLTPAPNGTTPNTTFSTPFTLLFQLTAPNGASSPTETFTVSGFVGNVNGQGARDISYGGGSTTFTFAGGSGTITTNPDAIGTQANQIGGRITATASTVPEPSTYALMGMGLVSLAAAVRRRNTVA
jgi:hypothetical protein